MTVVIPGGTGQVGTVLARRTLPWRFDICARRAGSRRRVPYTSPSWSFIWSP